MISKEQAVVIAHDHVEKINHESYFDKATEEDYEPIWQLFAFQEVLTKNKSAV